MHCSSILAGLSTVIVSVRNPQQNELGFRSGMGLWLHFCSHPLWVITWKKNLERVRKGRRDVILTCEVSMVGSHFALKMEVSERYSGESFKQLHCSGWNQKNRPFRFSSCVLHSCYCQLATETQDLTVESTQLSCLHARSTRASIYRANFNPKSAHYFLWMLQLDVLHRNSESYSVTHKEPTWFIWKSHSTMHSWVQLSNPQSTDPQNKISIQGSNPLEPSAFLYYSTIQSLVRPIGIPVPNPNPKFLVESEHYLWPLNDSPGYVSMVI